MGDRSIVGGAATILVALVAAACRPGAYNSLVGVRNECETAEQNVDARLEPRQDAPTTLSDAVGEHADHEPVVLARAVGRRWRVSLVPWWSIDTPGIQR